MSDRGDHTGTLLSAGDVRPRQVLLWAHHPLPGTVYFQVQPADGQAGAGPLLRSPDLQPLPVTGFTVRWLADGLVPDTAYRYQLRSADGVLARGRFRTAPAPGQASAVALLAGGDLGGQNVCRDARDGYAMLAGLPLDEARFFIALGDMIYADDPCTASGRYGNPQRPGPDYQARSREEFHAHWLYNLRDPGMARLRANLGYYAVWDDHEVVNDFGPDTARPGPDGNADIIDAGRAAFTDFNPVHRAGGQQNRFHDLFGWGRHDAPD